jgi:hypothetical protein
VSAAAAWVGLATVPDEWAVAALRMKDSRRLQGRKQGRTLRALTLAKQSMCSANRQAWVLSDSWANPVHS